MTSFHPDHSTQIRNGSIIHYYKDFEDALLNPMPDHKGYNHLPGCTYGKYRCICFNDDD